MIKILVFALWLISTSKGGGLNYSDLVDNVIDTYDECFAMVDVARDHVNNVGILDFFRRGTDGNAVQLDACVSLLSATDTYRGKLGRLSGAPEFVRWKDIVALDKWLKPLSKKLGKIPLYIASEDGDRADDFHGKCDGKGPTVVIIQTTTGNVFGGYADNSWASSGGHVNAPRSFLFRLRPSIHMYTLRSSSNARYAIYNEGGLGPAFGYPHDLIVRSSLTRTDSSVQQYFYNAPKHTLNDGVKNFQVKDYAVFSAVSL